MTVLSSLKVGLQLPCFPSITLPLMCCLICSALLASAYWERNSHLNLGWTDLAGFTLLAFHPWEASQIDFKIPEWIMSFLNCSTGVFESRGSGHSGKLNYPWVTQVPEDAKGILTFVSSWVFISERVEICSFFVHANSWYEPLSISRADKKEGEAV